MAKLTESEITLFKKFRALTRESFVPWTGGDESPPAHRLTERYEDEDVESLRASIRPRGLWLYANYKNRDRSHNPAVRQTGTKSCWSREFYHDSHGYRGRKPRKAHWTRD